MPELKEVAKDPRAQSAVFGALAAALVVIVGAPDKADPEYADKLATLGDAIKAGSAEVKPARADKLDTAVIHREVRKFRDADPQLVDLGGGIVEPGATYTTGGNVAKGTRLVAHEDCPGADERHDRLQAESLVCILDPGTWAITSAECRDRPEDAEHTWCEVTARNTGTQAQRLLVLVRTAE